MIYFNVTTNPTAQWTAQQIAEAFPFDTAPRFLLRDHDGIHGKHFQQRVKNMGIEEVKTVPRSPWQNPYAERIIGSIPRECLDHIIIFGENHLRRILGALLVETNEKWALEEKCYLNMDLLETKEYHKVEKKLSPSAV